MNPSRLPIYREELDLINAKLDALVKQEGLVDPGLSLYVGFLGKGHPFHFFRDMLEELTVLRESLEKDEGRHEMVSHPVVGEMDAVEDVIRDEF